MMRMYTVMETRNSQLYSIAQLFDGENMMDCILYCIAQKFDEGIL